MSKPWSRFFLVGILLIIGTAMAKAEGSSGSLEGRIISADNGAPLQGAVLQLDNLNTGMIRTASSNERGEYCFIDLPFGDYEVKASHRGHVTESRSIHINPGLVVHLNFLLRSPRWV